MNEERFKALLKWLSTAALVLFCTAPLVWMMLISLTDRPDFLLPQAGFSVTLQNYVDVLAGGQVHLLRHLCNSLLVASVAALATTLFALLSAYAITRLRFPGRTTLPIALLALSMFPQISIVGYLFKLMTALGWINTPLALIFPYTTLGLPLALWIMVSHLAQLPFDLDAAARVDGASRLQILRKIIVPLSMPAVASTALLVFVYSYNEFLFALMLTIDDRARTVPVGIALFEGLHGQVPWGHIMAAATIATVPVLVLAFLFQRYIIQGLTHGAVKG